MSPTTKDGARKASWYNIVSSPYYAKYQHKFDPDIGLEENTSPYGFQPLDFNPADMARDTNRSQVQGSLSFGRRLRILRCGGVWNEGCGGQKRSFVKIETCRGQ